VKEAVNRLRLSLKIFTFNSYGTGNFQINPLNAELNPICHLLALLGAHHILHLSRIRVNKSIESLPKVKGKAAPEGSRKLRFPDFMTKAQDGGKVVSLTHRPPLPPGNAPGTHLC